MRILSDQAILLEVVDLGERDRIVDFLTVDHGRRRGVAIAARSRRSRFAGQLQLLATVHARWVEKEGRDLGRLSELELVRPAEGMQRDLEGLLLSAYLAEQIRTFVQEGEPAQAFYRLLEMAVTCLLEGMDRRVVARYFEVWVLRLSGLLPVPRECPLCGRRMEAAAQLDEDAVLVCLDCAEGQRARMVPESAFAFLMRSGSENLYTFATRSWPDLALSHIESLCRAVRRSFLQMDLRSDRMLREILADLPNEVKTERV